MNKVIAILGLMLYSLFGYTQISTEAWENYEKSEYQDVENKQESDATIIFDRTYLKTNRYRDKIEYVTTIHRKIKINSLYGLEQFNKLYIPTFSDLHIKLEFINCKAKTLKKGQSAVITDTTNFVNSTLPANVPFFYKVDGNVRMLALSDINIGDEIEYIYAVKYAYDMNPQYFYKTSRESFSGSNYCMEKSIFYDTKGYNVRIWPYNFTNGATRKTDFSFSNKYGTGKKVMLTDIDEMSNDMYINSYVDEPYINYIISEATVVQEDTWEGFAKDFKPRRRETKRNYIFDGEKMIEAHKDIAKISGLKNKYEEILNKINQPIQDNFREYEAVKNNIDAAWGYAKILSKVTKNMGLPINFHFVKSKDYGKIEKTFQTLYQFQNIICSFTDEGTTYYFPLLEPYSEFNEIRNEYQGVECFTIKQDESGKRTHEFGTMPAFNPESYYDKEVTLKLSEVKSDSLMYTVNEKLKLIGNVWYEVQPLLSHIIRDTSHTMNNLKGFIRKQLVLVDHIDSVYNVEYEINQTDFAISYQYDLAQKIEGEAKIIDFTLDEFVENDFYTPFHLRNKRNKHGCLHNEYNTKYSITLDLDGKYQWMENKLMAKEKSNTVGNIKSSYSKNDKGVTANFELSYQQDVFTPEQWVEVVGLRDLSYNILNSKLFFEKNNF